MSAHALLTGAVLWQLAENFGPPIFIGLIVFGFWEAVSGWMSNRARRAPESEKWGARR